MQSLPATIASHLRRNIIAVLGLALLAGPQGAAAQGGLGVALEDDGGSGGPIALPPGARVMRDVAYGSDPAQRMDVYLPAQPQRAPVIFMVHGGGWAVGDKAAASVVANKVAHWLPAGFVLISANYRLLPRADPLGQSDDVAAALAAAQARVPSWGGDPARFILMGHSSGAHLVTLLAADPSIAARRGVVPWRGTIALDSAALDVVELMKSPHHPLYDRAFGADPDGWRRASPIHRLAMPPSPILLVCSSMRANACPQARAFAAKVTGLGGRADVLPVALRHGEINKALGLPGSYTESVDAFVRRLANL
ncbi:alpha/beta hydrolase [Vineibacter terrae]|uniref:Alpha/beta hydrolase n=1 Tax=Vineibacter terrae TaxID=2586908 RepID=A0A5C8PK51_9HYPH|nr:alpha/beta hydrolase [Vineibacter terrae]TXL74255.1 alpha/beta hydrolase [Vineibacter terrae]